MSADIALTVTQLGDGGTERYVRDLACGLARRGIRPVVIADSPPALHCRELAAASVPVEMVHPTAEFIDGSYAPRLRRILERYGPRLVHANPWTGLHVITAVVRECGLPMIVTRHCTDRLPRVRDLLGINRRPFALYRERARARRDTLPIISISRLSAANLRRRWGFDFPQTVIYNGVPYPQTEPAADPPPVIAWVGSMCERKRPFAALRIIDRVRRAVPAARLTMLGDGPLNAAVAEVAQRFAGSVETPGFVDDVPARLSRASVYLQTSADEGIAYSILEAMAAGLPVAATAAGATGEAVRDGVTGYLAPPDDETALAAAVIDLLGDRARRRAFGENGRREFEARFTIDRMVDETLDAYARLCGVALERAASCGSPPCRTPLGLMRP